MHTEEETMTDVRKQAMPKRHDKETNRLIVSVSAYFHVNVLNCFIRCLKLFETKLRK